jgi:hypothetical protein
MEAAAKEKTKFEKFDLVKMTIFNLFVCAPTCETDGDLEALEAAIREDCPAGTEGNWRLARHREDFCVMCANDPKRCHYVLDC